MMGAGCLIEAHAGDCTCRWDRTSKTQAAATPQRIKVVGRGHSNHCCGKWPQQTKLWVAAST